MSVDKTIAELSNTLSQLSILVEQINAQLSGITSRINTTLDNFDESVAGIATDAGAMTGQVGDTISQIPNSWIFYLLFITLIIVLILLSILIAINLVTKIHAIYHAIRGSDNVSLPYTNPKTSLDPYPNDRARFRSFSSEMENEPRTFGGISSQTNFQANLEVSKENNLLNGFVKPPHYEPYLRKLKTSRIDDHVTTIPSESFNVEAQKSYTSIPDRDHIV